MEITPIPKDATPVKLVKPSKKSKAEVARAFEELRKKRVEEDLEPEDAVAPPAPVAPAPATTQPTPAPAVTAPVSAPPVAAPAEQPKKKAPAKKKREPDTIKVTKKDLEDMLGRIIEERQSPAAPKQVVERIIEKPVVIPTPAPAPKKLTGNELLDALFFGK